MSKAVAKALEEIRVAIEKDDSAPPAAAIVTLLGEGLGFLERIALALEKPSIAAMGEGLVVGEIAKFEPVISPELTARALEILETISRNMPKLASPE